MEVKGRLIISILMYLIYKSIRFYEWKRWD